MEWNVGSLFQLMCLDFMSLDFAIHVFSIVSIDIVVIIHCTLFFFTMIFSQHVFLIMILMRQLHIICSIVILGFSLASPRSCFIFLFFTNKIFRVLQMIFNSFEMSRLPCNAFALYFFFFPKSKGSTTLFYGKITIH